MVLIFLSGPSRADLPPRSRPPAGTDFDYPCIQPRLGDLLGPTEGDREVVLGATVEELGFDHRVTAVAIYERSGSTYRDADDAEYALAETSVGWRPGTPDNAPILGRCELDGLVLATGHYRNGVLLTPLTADVISNLIITGELDSIAAPFTLDRFALASGRTR